MNRWRKIQQREIVITNKDDIMTCVQENNLSKNIREILCIQTRKAMSTDIIQGNSFLALAFEYAEELLLCPFFRSTFSVSYPF